MDTRTTRSCGKVCAVQVNWTNQLLTFSLSRAKKQTCFEFSPASSGACTRVDAGGSRLGLSFLILLPSVRHAPLRYMRKDLGQGLALVSARCIGDATPAVSQLSLGLWGGRGGQLQSAFWVKDYMSHTKCISISVPGCKNHKTKPRSCKDYEVRIWWICEVSIKKKLPVGRAQ